ncbi:hypothetical protein Drorol1_Dr00022266, partial [Drosera rotundifolia]
LTEHLNPCSPPYPSLTGSSSLHLPQIPWSDFLRRPLSLRFPPLSAPTPAVGVAAYPNTCRRRRRSYPSSISVSILRASSFPFFIPSPSRGLRRHRQLSLLFSSSSSLLLPQIPSSDFLIGFQG